MPKNYNIQTYCKQFTTEGSRLIVGDAVIAAGKTRYVTMVRIAHVLNSAAKGSRVLFCSATASNSATTLAIASTTAKLSLCIPSGAASHTYTKTVQIPSQPDTEHPLFTVAASKFLVAKLGSAAGTSATCNLFVQYYDQ